MIPFAENKIKILSNIYIASETGDVAELPCDEESQEILDVFDNIIVVRRSSFFKSDKICVAQVPEKDEEVDLKWIEITEAIKIDKLDGLISHCMELTSSNASDDVRKYHRLHRETKICSNNNKNQILFQLYYNSQKAYCLN